MKIAFKVTHNKKNNKDLIDKISLSYEERLIRRKKLTTDNGKDFLVNLENTISVDENNFFELDNGKLIEIISKKENLIQITGDNLKQIIWHIGNRHLPCQIDDNRILIQDDPVILDMILKLNGNIKKVFEVDDFDYISVDYTPGSWSYENEYSIYDAEGNMVVGIIGQDANGDAVEPWDVSHTVGLGAENMLSNGGFEGTWCCMNGWQNVGIDWNQWPAENGSHFIDIDESVQNILHLLNGEQ